MRSFWWWYHHLKKKKKNDPARQVSRRARGRRGSGGEESAGAPSSSPAPPPEKRANRRWFMVWRDRPPAPPGQRPPPETGKRGSQRPGSFHPPLRGAGGNEGRGLPLPPGLFGLWRRAQPEAGRRYAALVICAAADTGREYLKVRAQQRLWQQRVVWLLFLSDLIERTWGCDCGCGGEEEERGR